MPASRKSAKPKFSTDEERTVGPDKREVAQLPGVEKDSVEPIRQITVKGAIEESRKKAAELLDLDRMLQTRSYRVQASM